MRCDEPGTGRGFQIGRHALTGHKTESVYRRYAITDKTVQEEGVEKLARLFEGKKEARTTVSIRRAADR